MRLKTSSVKWRPFYLALNVLTHWGRVTHICVGNEAIIGSDNGLSPGRRQAIIWTNVGMLLIGPLGTNFSESLIEIRKFPFKKMHLKTSSAKWRPFWLDLNVLTSWVMSTKRRPIICFTVLRYKRDAVTLVFRCRSHGCTVFNFMYFSLSCQPVVSSFVRSCTRLVL